MNYQLCENLASLFFDQAVAGGDSPFLWSKRDGAYRSWSWRRVAETASELSRGLRAAGIGPGDRVVLVSENRPEWVIADIAVMAAGAVTVPAYATNTSDDHYHILSHSGAKAAIVSSPALAERLMPAARRADALQFVVSISPISGDAEVTVKAWDEVCRRGGEMPDDVVDTVAKLGRRDLACLIYTSGTGGRPKGVMLSHGAILCNVGGAHGVLAELGIGDEVFLSILPLSHAYEHTAGLFFPIAIGAQIYYAEGVDTVAANLLEARPTFMCCVPRLYETMRQRILAGVRRAGGGRAKLFHAALDLGLRKIDGAGGFALHERFVDFAVERLVREKVRARFGGRLRAMVSGGAALNYDVGAFFVALGLRVLQGYGQTEAAPVVTCNRSERVKLRSVGQPIAGAEVKLADDGEILVRGELLMEGYWNDAEATAAALAGGWLHTGDVGVVDDDGFLTITDRKKDIIVNSGGDNIAPQRVEGILTLEPEIAQAMVYGDGRAHMVALLVGEGAEASGEDMRGKLAAAVERANTKLSVIEKVKRFAIADEPFSVANGEMTPTLKVRRHAIIARYGDVLRGLYGAKAPTGPGMSG